MCAVQAVVALLEGLPVVSARDPSTWRAWLAAEPCGPPALAGAMTDQQGPAANKVGRAAAGNVDTAPDKVDAFATCAPSQCTCAGPGGC